MAVDDGRGAVQQVVQGVIVRVADLAQHAGYSIHKRVFLDDVETVLGTVYVCGFHGRVRWPTWVEIGRASCGERVCTDAEITGVPVSSNTKTINEMETNIE